MNLIIINRLQLRDYVSAVWESDKELELFYDSQLKKRDTKSMISDTLKKIDEYRENTATENMSFDCKMFGFSENQKPVGFAIINPSSKLLYSFGIKKECRDDVHLSEFFDFIRTYLKNEFSCLLYKRNTRAISWLKKCGMVDSGIWFDSNITILKYKK